MPAGPLTGPARAIDGDTLVVARETIRLARIDAPEHDQMCTRDGRAYACGTTASRELAALIAKQSVTCALEQRDRFGRLLGLCTVKGIELNRRMVELGWAVGYQGYADAEALARKAGRGLWSGQFERPRDFRREHGAIAWWWPW